MSSGQFNPTEWLEQLNKRKNKDRRRIFHEFGVEQLSQTAGTTFNYGNKNHRIMFHVFGVLEASQTA